MKKRSASVVPHDSEACKVTEQLAATQASAQGLLGPDVQSLTAMSSALPVYYGMPTFGASSSEKPSLDNSTASDPSGAGRPLLCSLDSEAWALHHTAPWPVLSLWAWYTRASACLMAGRDADV